MTKRKQIYKCNVCGNIVEVLAAGEGELVCCDEPMQLQAENTVAVIEKIDGGVKVKVGSVAHPMEAKHWIEWIEVVADGKSSRQVLEPGQPPEAVFALTAKAITAREYCNMHGLWKG